MHSELSKRCAISSAGRWILVPFFVKGFIGAVVVGWTFRWAGERAEKKDGGRRSGAEESKGWEMS